MSAVRAAIARRLAGPRDAGVSLTELIVTVMVTGVIAAIVSTMFLNVALATNNSTATITRNGIATNAMDAVSTVIRTAAVLPVSTSTDPDPAIVAGTGNSLTLYSFVNANPALPAPSKVAYRFDTNGTLFQDTWTATQSSGYWVFTGAVSTRTIAGPLVMPTGTDPMFVYLDDTGTVLTPGTNGLTASQRAQVAAIRLTVQVANSPTTGASNIVLVNTIVMPNVAISGTGG